MKDTKISWCDHTFNPWIGCTKVSPACDNCYAEQIASRFKMAAWGNHKRVLTSEKYWEQPLRWNKQSKSKHNAWSRFKEQYPGLSDEQLISKGFIKPVKPKVFCGSMCDIFDNSVPFAWRLHLFTLIQNTPYLDWLLLTKRIGNAQKMLDDIMRVHKINEPLDNFWLGITICNQKEADRDIPKLLNISSKKRFLSIEPMLGAIDLTCLSASNFAYDLDALNPENNEDTCYENASVDWVIVGGESGRKARPMHPDWVRCVRDQCSEACIPFFFKQWGEWLDRDDIHKRGMIPHYETAVHEFSNKENYSVMFRIGTKKSGCLIDGIEYNEVPL